MTKTQILKILTAWQTSMQLCEERMDQLAAVAGPVVESPLGDAVYGLMSAYTHQVADIIGWDQNTLSAWWLEQEFGKKPMQIGFVGQEMRTVATVEELAAFIAEDLARCEK